MTETLLRVENLTKHYPITEGVLKREVGRVKAVDGVGFTVERGETLGIVGESGCGKSTAATTLLRLEEPTDGSIYFDGEDITTYDAEGLKRFRRRAQMVFQDPTSSFDPRMSVGESVAEPLVIHGIKSRPRRRTIVKDLLERVGLDADDIDRYPHEFSGGQKQRIALARALIVNPDLIVADEPTSALDVSVQADILGLMDDIQTEFDLGMVFISHDMSVVREVCDRVAVMYLGQLVEIGETESLFADPQHPYTRALLASVPQPDPRQRGRGIKLSGDVPSPSNPPTGCRFHTRCPEVIPPGDYDFEQEEWRAVMDLRGRLERQGVDPDAIREFVVAEGEASTAEAVTDAQVAREVRREFGIPESLGDPDAEAHLADAIADVVDGDGASGLDRLRDAFRTPCTERNPELQRTESDARAACHLHDRELSAGTVREAADD